MEIVAEITCEAAGRTEDRPSLAAEREKQENPVKNYVLSAFKSKKKGIL